MNRVLLFLVICLFAVGNSLHAQTPEYSVRYANANGNDFPFNPYLGVRLQQLYYPSEFPAAPNGYISRIWFRSTGAQATSVYDSFLVSMGAFAQEGFMQGPFIGGLDTAFYADRHTIQGVTVNGWVPITLQRPHYFDGRQNLIVSLVVKERLSGGFEVATDNNAGLNRRLAGPYSEETAYPMPALNDFGFDLAGWGTDNAGIAGVYAPVPFCSGSQDIKLRLVNAGTNRISAVTVHWEMDGQPQTPFSFSGTIDTLRSAAGNSAEITLASGVSFTGKPRTVKAWTVDPNSRPDTDNVNDTIVALVGPRLNGSYTVGGNQPDFNSPAEAADVLRRFGVCGPVEFVVRSGVYTGNFTIGSIAGTGSGNTVRFRSEAGVADSVVMQYTPVGDGDNYVMRLIGVSDLHFSNVSFETVPLASPIARAGVVLVLDSMDRCSFDSCRFVAPEGRNWNLEYKSLFTARNIKGDGNRITNSAFEGGADGLYYTALNTRYSEGVVIDNNVFQGATRHPLRIQYAEAPKIRGNRVHSDGTSNNYSAVYVANCSGALEFTGNKVTGATIGYGLNFANNYATASGRALIANNVVSTSATNAFYCGNSSYQRIYNNSVYSASALASANAANFSFTSTTGTQGGNEVYNNLFFQGGAGKAMNIRNNASNTGNVWDYNNLFTFSGAVLVEQYNRIYFPDLQSWRLSSGQDLNSISAEPFFTDYVHLVPDPADPGSWALNGRGRHLPEVTEDYNGNPRPVRREDGVPDIGAYETEPQSVPPAAMAEPALPESGKEQVFTMGGDTVAVIDWGVNVPASAEMRIYTGTRPPQIGPGSGFMYFYTDLNTDAGAYDAVVRLYYKAPWTGTVAAESAARMTLKQGLLPPWVTDRSTASSIDTQAGRLSAPCPDMPVWLTATDVLTNSVCGGVPIPAVIDPPAAAAICEGASLELHAADPNLALGLSGYSYIWEQSVAEQGPWLPAAGTAAGLTYLQTAVPGVTWYRVTSTCDYTSDMASGPAVAVTVHQAPVPEVFHFENRLRTESGYPAYQWYRDGLALENGKTNVFTPDADGAYAVEVTDRNGCKGMSEPVRWQTGIADISADAELNVYPNPAADYLFWEYTGPVTVEIFNFEGRLVRHARCTGKVFTGDLSPGIYLLQISSGDMPVSRKARFVRAAASGN